MIQDIGKGRFHNEYKPQPPVDSSIVLSYKKHEVLLRKNDAEAVQGEIRPAVELLTYKELKETLPEKAENLQYLFRIDDTTFFLADTLDEQAFAGMSYETVRLLREAGPKEMAFAAITGHQLFDWYRTRKFCPACGQKMEHDVKERMMKCPACGQMEYPKIMPAVIVGVYHGDRLLMSKYAGRAITNYALIAGFCEIGESVEDCVHREVMEETGLRVKNLQYYRSQPWSFTGTLLMGFFCELDGDENIQIDAEELALAGFFTRDMIPEDKGLSLTGEMMQYFKDGKIGAK